MFCYGKIKKLSVLALFKCARDKITVLWWLIPFLKMADWHINTLNSVVKIVGKTVIVLMGFSSV